MIPSVFDTMTVKLSVRIARDDWRRTTVLHAPGSIHIPAVDYSEWKTLATKRVNPQVNEDKIILAEFHEFTGFVRNGVNTNIFKLEASKGDWNCEVVFGYRLPARIPLVKTTSAFYNGIFSHDSAKWCFDILTRRTITFQEERNHASISNSRHQDARMGFKTSTGTDARESWPDICAVAISIEPYRIPLLASNTK